MNEQAKKQIDAIVELLSDTEFSLESFDLEPVEDENGDVTSLKFTLVTDLLDLQEGSDSSLKVIEDHFIGDNYSFKEVLEKINEAQEDE